MASHVINIPQHNGTFFTIGELTLTPYYHPKSVVYFRFHSWCCVFYNFGQMYNDTYLSLSIMTWCWVFYNFWQMCIHPIISLPCTIHLLPQSLSLFLTSTARFGKLMYHALFLYLCWLDRLLVILLSKISIASWAMVLLFFFSPPWVSFYFLSYGFHIAYDSFSDWLIDWFIHSFIYSFI